MLNNCKKSKYSGSYNTREVNSFTKDMKCALMNSFLYKIHNGIFILKGVQYVFSGKK